MKRLMVLSLCLLLAIGTGGCVSNSRLQDSSSANLYDYDTLYDKYLNFAFRSGVTAQTWDNPNNLDPDSFVVYYVYCVTWGGKEYPDYESGFPADDLESYVKQYFNVETKTIRSSTMYDAQKNVYHCEGLGGAASAKVVGATKEGNRLTLTFEVYSGADDITVLWGGDLTIEFSGDNFKYVSCVQRENENPSA